MATNNLFKDFNVEMDMIFCKYMNSYQFMLLLNQWIVKNEEELQDQYGV